MRNSTKSIEDKIEETAQEVQQKGWKAGEKIKMGEQITIVIPEIEYKYPDFTKDWSLVKIEDFCEKHELKLSTKYEVTDKYKEGTIIKQSREKDSVVTPGASLTITIAKAPEVEEEEIEENPDVEVDSEETD